MAVYAWDTSPVLKLLLHAAKYPSAAINGLLLGTITAPAPSKPDPGSPPASPRAPQPRRIHVVDVVPLFHSFLSFTMPLETALVQVAPPHPGLLLCSFRSSEDCSKLKADQSSVRHAGSGAHDKESRYLDAELLSECSQVHAYAAEKQLQVVGVYHASERLDDASLSPVAARIGEKLQQRCCAQSAVFIVRSPSNQGRTAERCGDSYLLVGPRLRP